MGASDKVGVKKRSERDSEAPKMGSGVKRGDVGVERGSKRQKKLAPAEESFRRKPLPERVIVSTKGPERRDPRFDSMAGDVEADVFRSKYGFLLEDYESETKAMSKELKKKGKKMSLEEKRAMQSEIAKRKQELARRRDLEAHRDVMRSLKEERKGKKPFFLKRSAVKELALAAKFKRVEEEGGTIAVERMLRKKRAKNAAKDMRKLGKAKDASRKRIGE